MKPEGIFVPIVVPFNRKGEIDNDALRDLIDYLIDAKVTGIVPCGSTSEAPYLSREERKTLIGLVLDQVNGRAQVIAGTGAIGTRETITLTNDALEAGVDAALVITPFYYKLSEKEIYNHYATLLDTVDLPIIIYNMPKFTSYSIPPALVERLVSEYDGIIGIKESSGNPGLMADIIQLVGEKISFLTGSADLILSSLMLGGRGALIAVANMIPKECVNLYKTCKENNIEKAVKLQQRVSSVTRVILREHNQITALKEAMRLRGKPMGVPRQPILPLDDTERKELATALKHLNLI